MPHTRPLLPLALLLVCAAASPAQRRPPRATGAQSRTGSATRSTTDQYWAAQRSIEAAIQQLESYLSANPDGERTATARQQLEELRALSAAATLPEWARMEPRAPDNSPQWRIASVERQADVTRVTLEIRCPRADGGECYFLPFDRFPLVLVDQRGRFYPMTDAGTLPRDVRVTGRERAEVTPGQAVLTGGRSVNITVAFAPLEGGVVSVQLYYRDDNRAEPAKFSLRMIR